MSIYNRVVYYSFYSFFLCFAAEATGQSASQTGSGTAPGGRRGAGTAGCAVRSGPARGPGARGQRAERASVSALAYCFPKPSPPKHYHLAL